MASHATHNKCDHVLAFCEKCEVPYCSWCYTEWAQPCLLNHYINYNYPNAPYIYPGTTWTSVGADTAVAVGHAGHAE